MKNIFVYIGSRSGIFSNTLRFTNMILDKVAKLAVDKINIEIYHPENSYIKRCIGCASCFNSGMCTLDSQDDMEILKKKMLEADFIIFATPIYAANVTGDMKIFFDRISYWMHLMRLCGKPFIGLTTSVGNGTSFVLNYLHTVASFLGLNTVAKFNVNICDAAELDNENFMKEEVEKYSQIIIDFLTEVKKVESNQTLEMVFCNMKRNIKCYEEFPNYEYVFWKENGLLQLNTFEEAINKSHLIKECNGIFK